MDTMIFKPLITYFIAFTLLIMRMSFAIDFNAQLRLGTIEIEHVGTKRMLVAKDDAV